MKKKQEEIQNDQYILLGNANAKNGFDSKSVNNGNGNCSYNCKYHTCNMANKTLELTSLPDRKVGDMPYLEGF